MPRNTVAEVLGCFEDEFADVAKAFARGEYLLWLGSGISRDVVPGVPQLLKQMLEYLREQADDSDSDCRFRKALDEVLEVAGVPATTRASLDLRSTVDSWPGVDDIVARLVNQYADVLDVQVRGEAPDFLVWSGLDVPNTYGDADLEPDVEHLCVAILMLEGVIKSVPTTNWDGLVEAAMELLSADGSKALKVVVQPAEFRASDQQAELLKFHGCAVRAAADEAGYRRLLVARKSQISGWTEQPENLIIQNYLVHLFATRPAFIVGLSAQDADIHTVMHRASRGLVRSWPVSPAAVVFAEHSLHHHHKHVMRVTYGDSYAANADEIGESALLGAYAKPALLGLVLFTLADKMCELIACADLPLPGDDVDRISADIRQLRNDLAAAADADPRTFVHLLVSGLALVLSIFRQGQPPDLGCVRYQPVSVAPVQRALESPDFPGATLGRLAIAVSLVSRGLSAGLWGLSPGAVATPNEGVIRVTKDGQATSMFVVRDARVLSKLEVDGLVDLANTDTLVLQADSAPAPAVRAPNTHYGRTGRGGARLVDVEQLCAEAGTADGLFEAFRHEAAL